MTFARVVLLPLLVVAGCANERIPRPRAPRSESRETPAPAGPRREIARGSERAALLALRRVHFALDDATLPPPSRGALSEAAEHLRGLDVSLAVEGHADERGTTDYNLALGQRRADVVTGYLENLGIASERLRGVSYGEERPAAEGSDPDTWSRNRRVEFSLLRGNVQLVLEDGVRLSDSGRPMP
jgi:peptidoglycan-associated lipoprotein